MSGMSDYTSPTTVAAVGNERVAFMTCERCGACLMVTAFDFKDVASLHNEWHSTLELDVAEPEHPELDDHTFPGDYGP